MASTNQGLGADFDIGTQIGPVDLADGANTGHRIHLMNYGAVTFVGYLGVGTAAEAPTFTLQEHNANTGGTSQNLAVIDEYWQKEELALDGDETWTRVAQTAAATVTDADWDDANQVLVAFKVRAEQLTDAFEWVSVNVADPGTAHIGTVFAIMHDLKTQRTAQNLVQPNA
jgi:hypothetical protein